MTNITNWTQKFAGIDEYRPEHYPVVLSEINQDGHEVKKWLIGIYHDQETASKVRSMVEKIVTIGEDSPPLTGQYVEDVKRNVTI